MENQNINVNETVEDKAEGGAVETNAVEVKTYTQEEVNELLKGYKSKEEVNAIVNDRLARERKKAENEKEEAKKLAIMSAEEKAQYEFNKRVEELEAREREIARKELENEASSQLKDLGINVNAVKFVMGNDAETTHSNIKAFASLVSEIKESTKKDLLRGTTPKVSTKTSKTITKEEWNKMNLVQRQKIYNSNRNLYNELNK